MANLICIARGCDRRAIKKGVCSTHYGRRRRGLDIDAPVVRRVPKGTSAYDRVVAMGWSITASGCWEFARGRNHDGYGIVANGRGGNTTTHRAVYEHLHGPVPAGHVVRHTCDNRACVNPAHLILGRQLDNVHDAINRGRFARGENVPTYKLTDADVLEVRRLYKDGIRGNALGSRFPDVTKHHLYMVGSGRKRTEFTNRG